MHPMATFFSVFFFIFFFVCVCGGLVAVAAPWLTLGLRERAYCRGGVPCMDQPKDEWQASLVKEIWAH